MSRIYKVKYAFFQNEQNRSVMNFVQMKFDQYFRFALSAVYVYFIDCWFCAVTN
jgi:hypothetical protein